MSHDAGARVSELVIAAGATACLIVTAGACHLLSRCAMSDKNPRMDSLQPASIPSNETGNVVSSKEEEGPCCVGAREEEGCGGISVDEEGVAVGDDGDNTRESENLVYPTESTIERAKRYFPGLDLDLEFVEANWQSGRRVTGLTTPTAFVKNQVETYVRQKLDKIEQ